MAYKDEGGSPGSVPEFGAIFMSSCSTKKECLKRKLLGLPPAQANFVKQVKAGMILFLFEFEKRELYGVYRASSDGAMNIVPHAFDSSGRQFPAQVRFTVIWDCKSLLEHEFRDAISENYYTNKKFNFGLSEDQVRKLLYLFSSRKSENRAPQRQIGRQASLTEKERICENEKVNKRNRQKFGEEDSLTPIINTDYTGDYPSEGRVLGRRKRAAEDSMDLIQEKIGFNFDERTRYSRPVGDHDLRESLYSSRLNKEDQSFYRDNVETEDSSDFLTRDRRDLRDDLGQMRDMRESKHSQSDDGLRLGKRVESFEIPQTEPRRPISDLRDYVHSSFGGPKSSMSMIQSDENFFARARWELNDEAFEIPRTELRRSIDDQRFFTDHKVDYDPNFEGFRNSIPTDGASDCLGKVRKMDDDERTRIRRSADSSITQIVSNRLDKVRRVTDDRNRIRPEEFTSRLDYRGKLNYQESVNSVENALGHVSSTVHSGHFMDKIKQLDDEHILRKSDGLENAYTTGNNSGNLQPSFNSNDLSQNPHNTSLFSSSVEQRMYATSYPTSFKMEDKYGLPNPTSGDMVLSRSVPYDPDFPEVDATSRSVEEYIPRHIHVGNDIAASIRKSPYYTEAENLSFQSDGSLPRVIEVPMHENKDLYAQYDRRMHKSHPPISNENFNDCDINHKFQGNETDPASSDFQDLLLKYGMGRANLGTLNENVNNYDIEANQDPDPLPTDSKNRTSVFARLSIPSRKCEPENEGYMEKEELDASVDEVMDTVYEFLSQKITKADRHSPLSKRHKKEVFGTKRKGKRLEQKQYDVAIVDDKPTMKALNIVIESEPGTDNDENADCVLKETRVVEFKRRSEINRTRNEGKSSDQKLEVKDEVKPLKRRRLIRPAFGQKEKLNEDSESDVSKTKCRSPKSQIDKKLGGPVFSEKEELNNVSIGDVHTNLQVTSSKNEDSKFEFSGTSVGSLTSLSPKSRKKLVRPPSLQNEESNVHLLSTHESSNNPEAATYDFAGEELESSSCSLPNSGSLVPRPPSVSVENKDIETKQNLENEALKTFE